MPGVTLRVSKATIKDYVKGSEDLTSQKYGGLKYLKSKGRVTMNQGGTDREWKVNARRNAPVGMGDMEVMVADRIDRYQKASISWRSQGMDEAISKREKLENKGPEAIVKIFEKLTKQMTDDFMCDLDKQIWLDGSDAARPDKLEGFTTICGKTGDGTAQYPVPTATTHTYAGLDMSLGFYGGTTTGSYPTGVADPEYYFWTPFQTNYTHTNFGGSDWETNCIEALRYTLTLCEAMRGDLGRPDMLWLPPTQFAQFKNAQDEKERIVVQRGQDSDAVKLGFKSVNFEGYDLVMDYHIPAGMIFGFKAEDTELASLQDQLIDVANETTLETRSERIALDFHGNMKHNPRSLTFLDDFT